MKNPWFEFIYGIVTVKVSGRGIERFINILIRNNLIIWMVKRHGSETITFKMRAQEAKNIRHIARNSECSITFLQRKGLPFLLKRLFKNSGFLVGATLFMLTILYLSNIIWGIEIKGADPKTEYQIRKELDNLGVKIGKFQLFVDNVETIQRELTNNIDNITWVGVKLQGTTYHLQVVEKKEPKKQRQLTPRNLVAKKEATIVNYYINSGQRVIDKNEHVEPGQLLVSGKIGLEGQPILVAAEGEVWGETWYKVNVKLPLKTEFKVYTGKEEQKYFITVGKLNIPIWGFGTEKFNKYETEDELSKFHFLKWDLPISFLSRTIRESEEVTRIYTNKEAEQNSVEIAKKEVKRSLDKDAIIKDAYILDKKIKNGVLIIAYHITSIENIAVEKPITEEN